MLEALIFDFDGLILDTETPLYLAWAHTFEHYGARPIGLSEWARSLGLHQDDPAGLDPLRRLQDTVRQTLDPAEVQCIRRRFRDDLLDSQPVQPGVHQLLDQAAYRDLPVAIASSSPSEWIERHLDARGLRHRFPVLSCAGEGVPGKPHPAVYLDAARQLGIDPTRCLALEDSPNGATAAKAAGTTCIVVPTRISRNLDLRPADHVLESLVDLDLDHWISSVGRHNSDPR